MKKWGLPVLVPGIRLQLALWYTSISTLLLLLFGVTFYLSFQAVLATSLDTNLQMRAQQIAEGIFSYKGKLVVEDVVKELPELNATAALIDTVHNDNDNDDDQIDASDSVLVSDALRSDLYIRILDDKGTVVYVTPLFKTLSLPSASVKQPLTGKPWRGTVTSSKGQTIRLYSTMLLDNSGVRGVVQIGQPLTELNDRLKDILLALLLITPLAILLSAVVCYWLAGRAFRPIRRLAETAHEIEATDLHQRVPVPLARDEVRDLSLIFNQMVERLEHAFAQQRRFVADASHELRTPVAVIRSMTEVALSQPSDRDDYISVLQGVNSESERLGQLINDLLALARADEGQVVFDSDAVRLDLLAADVVDSMAPLAEERQIHLRVEHLQPATVLGDAARLIQVIMSLVDNALTYTNAGGSVTLSVEAEQEQACLTVTDTGIGISAEDKAHIFERFYRADPARSRAAGGSGLGLAIVDWLVKTHGGTVTVESQLGKGSTFTVTLPLEVEAPTSPPMLIRR
jgi:two-component system OmpR family sensor kinase